MRVSHIHIRSAALSLWWRTFFLVSKTVLPAVSYDVDHHTRCPCSWCPMGSVVGLWCLRGEATHRQYPSSEEDALDTRLVASRLVCWTRSEYLAGNLGDLFNRHGWEYHDRIATEYPAVTRYHGAFGVGLSDCCYRCVSERSCREEACTSRTPRH